MSKGNAVTGAFPAVPSVGPPSLTLPSPPLPSPRSLCVPLVLDQQSKSVVSLSRRRLSRSSYHHPIHHFTPPLPLSLAPRGGRYDGTVLRAHSAGELAACRSCPAARERGSLVLAAERNPAGRRSCSTLSGGDPSRRGEVSSHVGW
jgi:hypothetical protein